LLTDESVSADDDDIYICSWSTSIPVEHTTDICSTLQTLVLSSGTLTEMYHGTLKCIALIRPINLN